MAITSEMNAYLARLAFLALSEAKHALCLAAHSFSAPLLLPAGDLESKDLGKFRKN